MNYNNISEIIRNNIQLFNCIKLKFQDWYKIELWFKFSDKDLKELFFYQSIDLKTWQVIFTSKEYELNELNELNKDIEILIYENLFHLKEILENRLNINN